MLLFEHAAALDYGQVSRNQGAGNGARDFACAAEDDHIAIGAALVVLVAHIVDDAVDLAGFIGGGCQRNVGVGMRWYCRCSSARTSGCSWSSCTASIIRPPNSVSPWCSRRCW